MGALKKDRNTKWPFKYYVIKEEGGWGQKMAIFDIYSTVNHQRGGWPKKVKNGY